MILPVVRKRPCFQGWVFQSRPWLSERLTWVYETEVFWAKLIKAALAGVGHLSSLQWDYNRRNVRKRLIITDSTMCSYRKHSCTAEEGKLVFFAGGRNFWISSHQSEFPSCLVISVITSNLFPSRRYLWSIYIYNVYCKCQVSGPQLGNRHPEHIQSQQYKIGSDGTSTKLDMGTPLLWYIYPAQMAFLPIYCVIYVKNQICWRDWQDHWQNYFAPGW